MPSDHRLHPASVVFSFASQLKNFVLPGVLVLIGAGRAGANWEPWLMLLLIPNTVVALIHYMSFRYRYDAHEMVIRQGLIFRSERHVPYARIQNLDAVQNIAHRALGVVEVRVQTGSGNEPEAVMSVIPAADFQEMRRRVFEQRPSAESPEIVPVIASPPPLLRLTIRDLMIAGFIENRGMIVIATLFGVLYEFGG
ncbi:MAG TPA: PH domain-containing protein, partial [Longimicrobiales bacterium]|nr:PH domain-containing protein [Longimicrobiales bacterium]